jgi:hypothetical protein
MKPNEVWSRFAPLVVIMFGLAAMGPGPCTPLGVTLVVSPASPVAHVGDGLVVTAIVTDGGSYEWDVSSLAVWSSSAPGVATVDAAGDVSALAFGTATLTAVVGTSRASTTINVLGPGVSLAPTDLAFAPQLVATSGPHLTETVINEGDAPLVITAIGISGSDAADFTPDLPGLPATVAPGERLEVPVAFLPVGPWKPGTRQAQLVFSDNAGNQSVAVAGMGTTCAGPVAACASGCADTDGDGLNDDWEAAQGIDSNNDGTFDPEGGDLSLPGADPNKPDLYVQYDWMDYGPMETPCTTNSDCTVKGGLSGFSCSGPAVTAGSLGSCVHSCNVDSDCTSLGPSHVADRCGGPVGARECYHSHDPALLVPNGNGGSAALDAVVAAFAGHGIAMHVIRGHPLPHSHVLSLRRLNDPQQPIDVISDTCEGGSVASGRAGAGKYAESFYDLKAGSFDPKALIAFHYVVFAHYSACDSEAHCNLCPASVNPDGTQKSTSVPRVGQSGIAEESGNDLIISLASFNNETGNPPDPFNVGGTFMHELGHNLGLFHGGGFLVDGTAESFPAFKPNYLSVMNYNYQLVGIPMGANVGDDMVASRRLDYSTQVLPTGTATPGLLDENANLDEAAGLGSGAKDIFSFTDGLCHFQHAATNGPVDWDGDGAAGDNSIATADLDPPDHPLQPCGASTTIQFRGHVDWPPNAPQPMFTYAFQCAGGSSEDGVSAEQGGAIVQNELTTAEAARMHVMLPLRHVQVVVRQACSMKSDSSARLGAIKLALLGAADFDVAQVEPSSLTFRGAGPTSLSIRDVNGDGHPDMLVEFQALDIKIVSHPDHSYLHGWLKNSQMFVGEDVGSEPHHSLGQSCSSAAVGRGRASHGPWHSRSRPRG